MSRPVEIGQRSSSSTARASTRRWNNRSPNCRYSSISARVLCGSSSRSAWSRCRVTSDSRRARGARRAGHLDFLQITKTKKHVQPLTHAETYGTANVLSHNKALSLLKSPPRSVRARPTATLPPHLYPLNRVWVRRLQILLCQPRRVLPQPRQILLIPCRRLLQLLLRVLH